MAGPMVVAAVDGRRVYRTMPAKNGMPAHSMKVGVAPATPLHPRRSNRTGDTNMRVPVTRPVHMATSPMNACRYTTTKDEPWAAVATLACYIRIWFFGFGVKDRG